VGDFTKIGGNTVTLSGLNTYTGNTYVNEGTLLAGVGTPGGPGASGPGPFGQNSAVWVSEGAILQLNGFNVSIAALLGSPGGRVQNASSTPATLTLTGVDNFGYFNGIIQDGLLGSQQQFHQPSSFEPVQTPAALSLWMAGSGVQTLAGLNTYTGTTMVTSGILRAGVSNEGGVGATGPGAFGNNSAVTVSGTGILQLFGNDVGIGSLAGDAGGIVENGGGFQARNPSNIESEGEVGTATLTLGGNNTDTTFAGTIRDGSGSFQTRRPAGEQSQAPITGPLAIFKTGTGTQTLTGNNTYTGGTTVAQGTLVAGSTKAFGNGDLTMTGGILRTTGPLSVDVGAGNILFSGGIFQVNVGGLIPAVQHDQLLTTGMANISGGTLALIQLNNFHLVAGNKIVLISAAGGVAGGSANGTSDPNVTGLSAFSNSPLIVPVVNLYTTSVVLEALQGSFKICGLTPNQTAVVCALDSLLGVTGGKTGVFKELDFLDNQPICNLPSLLDLISPEELTLVFQLAKSLANIQTSNIQSHLDEIHNAAFNGSYQDTVTMTAGLQGPKGPRGKEIARADEARWSLWMAGSGEFTTVGNTANATGYSLDSGGLTTGVDYRFTDKFVAGISLGYMNTSASLINGGSVDVDGGRVGAYATYFDRGLYVDASVSGGPNSYRTKRVTPNNTVATGSPEGTEVNLMLATGYDWKMGGLTIGPVASFQYTNVTLDGFTETGAFAPLSFLRKSAESLRSAVGIRASYDIKAGNTIIRPEVRASWQHEFGDTTYSLESTFATLGGSAFTAFGPTTGRDSLLVRAGFSILWNDRFSTYAYYDAELLRTNYSSNNVSVGFRWRF
jgi:autotransporter-associated beta strand protein